MNSLSRSLLLLPHQRMAFTRAFRKVVLTKDVPNLGFRGETCFVKPGYAFNSLVPRKMAMFATDPAAAMLSVDPAELQRKQEMRTLELFLNKLKDIKLIFSREVSEINKNVAKAPVDAVEVLESLNRRYNMGIKKQDFKMQHSLDSIGEHFVPVVYASEHFDKDFSFFVKVQIRPTVKVEPQGRERLSAKK